MKKAAFLTVGFLMLSMPAHAQWYYDELSNGTGHYGSTGTVTGGTSASPGTGIRGVSPNTSLGGASPSQRSLEAEYSAEGCCSFGPSDSDSPAPDSGDSTGNGGGDDGGVSGP
jgi:hypothetical protein